MSRLSAGLPGTTASPLSPPSSSAARESTRKFDHCFSGPWHLMQCSTKTGRTWVSKNRNCGAENSSAAAGDMARRIKRNERLVGIALSARYRLDGLGQILPRKYARNDGVLHPCL